MNIVGKLSLTCLVLFAAQAMCFDSASTDQQSNDATIEKIVRAVYKTIDNQKWLTAFLLTVPYVQFWIAPGMYSKPLFTYLFGSKVFLDEFTEQMKANFEGDEPQSVNTKKTFFTLLAIFCLEYKLNKRLYFDCYY